jgi:hypothetical protein
MRKSTFRQLSDFKCIFLFIVGEVKIICAFVTFSADPTLLRSYRKTRSCGLDLAGERLSGKGLVAEAPLCVIADGLLAVLERTEEEHPPENLAGGLRGVWRG